MRLLIIALMLAGCATDLTDEEREERDFQREYKYAETYNDWVLCQQAFSHKGIRWVTFDATRSKFRNKKPLRITMRQEMRHNKCRIDHDRIL